MSQSARSARRNAPKSAFFTRKALFATALVMVSAIAGLAAFGPQSLSLTKLFAGATAEVKTFREVEPQLHAEPPAPMALASGTLATPRSGHTATLLNDGKVLVVGGSGDTSAEIVDGGTASPTNNTNHARSGHTATLLPDGRVLIAGGSGDASTEIYDPSTGTFSLGPNMAAARTGHTATAVGSSVIITGGGNNSVEVFDGTAFTAAGSLTESRTNHSAALMNDGRVFIAGGTGSATAEIYNPADGTSTATGNPLAHQRSKPHLRVLPDGKVQIIGGNDDVSMEVYDPAIDTVGAHVHLLPDTDTCTGLRTGVRDSQTRAALFFAGNADAAYDRTGHTITEISGNQALVIGGTTGGSATNSVTTFASSPATITTDKLDYAPGETVTFSGTGFAPNETVRVVIHEDPHTHLERNFEAVADASGNITGNYLVESHDVGVRFVVAARGNLSDSRAITSFTDGPVHFRLATSGTAIPPAQLASFTWSVNFNQWSGSSQSTTCSSANSPNPLVATYVGNTGSGIPSPNSNQSVRVTSVQATGAFAAVYVFDYWSASATSTTPIDPGCVTGTTGSNVAGEFFAHFKAVAVSTTTEVTSSSNPSTYGQAVTFTATVTRSSGTGTPTGSVNFNIADLGTVAGTPGATTSTTATWTYTTAATALSAGNHSVTADYSPTGSFTASSGSLTGGQEVNKAATETTVTCADGTYTGLAVETCTYTVTGAGGLNIGPLPVPPANYTNNIDAGNETASASFTYTESANHLSSNDSDTFSIAKANATIVVNGYSVPYDGQPHGLTGTATGVGGADLSSFLTYGAPVTDVPGGLITWNFDAGTNYNTASGSATVNITPISPTVVATGGTFAYDGDPHTGSCSVTGVGGADLGPLAATHTPVDPPVDADPYTVNCDYPGSTNYNAASDTESLTIAKAATSITAPDVSATYGGQVTYSAILSRTTTPAGLLAGKTVVFKVNGTQVGQDETDANGLAQITIELTTDGTPTGALIPQGFFDEGIEASFAEETNFTGSTDTADLTVTPAAVTPSITATDKIYDGNADAFIASCTVAPLEVGDDVECVVGTATYDDGKDVGEDKAITASSITLTGDDAANYSLGTNTTATTTADIDARLVTVTILAQTKVYDGTKDAVLDPTDFVVTTGVTDEVFTVNQTIGEYDDANVIAASTVTASLAVNNFDPEDDEETSNYTFPSFALGAGTITPATPTVAVAFVPNTVTYDGASHPASASVTGVAGPLTVPGSDGSFVITYLKEGNPSGEPVNAGSYTASVAFTSTNTNYTNANSTTDGSLTISKAPVTATAGGGSATYDGNTKTPSACAITGPGYLGDLTCDNDPATVGPGANTYTIEPVVSGTGLPNFDITEVNGTYIINKANATIVVTPYDVFYDGQPHTATGTATGAAGENLNSLLDLSGTTHTDAAAYPGDPWSFAGDSNHEPANGTVDNNIDKAPVTATAGGGSATYDGNTKTPSACAITGPGYLGDLTCDNDPATVGPGANTYTIEPVVSGTGLSNFDITEVNGSYVIEKRLATWTTNPNSKTYGDPDPAGVTTGSGSNFVAADNVTATYSRVAGENASPPTYHITATLSATPMSALDNYTITNNGAAFTINKRTITVTPNSGQYKSFGQPDPVLTYTFSPTPLPFSDTFTGALSRDAGELVGQYNITQGTLALNPDNYILVFTPNVKFEIKTIYCFNGFHSPVGGSVESGNGGSFANPVRSFKLNSTIPFKFTLYNVGCTGTPVTSGVHTLQLIKYSTAIADPDPPIDATPTDAATTGNQFRLTGTDWHFNLDTKKTPGLSAGTWLVKATLFDGSTKTVWISIKK